MRRAWYLVGLFWAANAYAQVPPPAKPEPLPSEYHSIFFSDQEMITLNGLEQKRKNQLIAGIGLQEAEQPANEPQTIVSYYTYPQFYLNSLAYQGANRWTFWLNRFAYNPSNAATLPGLTIEEVSSNYIMFKFRAKESDPIDFRSDDHGANVQTDAASRTITFTLRPNQTFSTYTLKTYEGQVEPVTVNAGQIDPALLPKAKSLPGLEAVFNPLLPEEEPSVTPEPTPPSNQGFEGLLNRNKALEKPQ